MVGSFGWAELLLITAAVIIFMGGGNRLPEIARSLGEAIREFKRSANPDNELENDDKDESDSS